MTFETSLHESSNRDGHAVTMAATLVIKCWRVKVKIFYCGIISNDDRDASHKKIKRIRCTHRGERRARGE